MSTQSHVSPHRPHRSCLGRPHRPPPPHPACTQRLAESTASSSSSVAQPPVFPVVGLRHPVPPSMGPVVELVPVGRRHLHLARGVGRPSTLFASHLVGRPEPSVDQLGEELRLVTTVKVAFPAQKGPSPSPQTRTSCNHHQSITCPRSRRTGRRRR